MTQWNFICNIKNNTKFEIFHVTFLKKFWFTKNDRGEFCADVKKTYDGSVVGQKGRQTPVINGKGKRYSSLKTKTR